MRKWQQEHSGYFHRSSFAFAKNVICDRNGSSVAKTI
jgi:hypothetical protein